MSDSEVLSLSARERLVELVLAGELQPGERLKELVLCKKLKISRTPLREALISLVNLGLVSSEPNVGFRVKVLSVKEAEEIYPLIILLEKEALSLAFPLLRTQTKELLEINAELKRKRKSAVKAALADRQFHHLLCSFCRNGTLLQMIGDLRLRISCYEHRYMADSELLETSIQQHQALIEATQANDVDAALSALDQNWRFGMRVLVARLMTEMASGS